jgi:hypothetical protein
MYVKPIDGATVRYPVTLGILPKDGAEVPDDTYWNRRVRDGSVIVVTAPAVPAVDEAAATTQRTRGGKAQ